MRNAVKDFISIISQKIVLPEPIYEFGSRQYFDGYENECVRSFFQGREYLGCDINPGKGVDKVLDLHNIDLPDNSVGTIITIDTMEHVKYPHKAMQEIHRVLKYDGIVLISSVMDYEIHGAPYDYWRFTPHGFENLLEQFQFKSIYYSGYDEFPSSVIAVALKRGNLDLSIINEDIANWKEKWKDEKYDQYILQSKIHSLEEQLKSYKAKQAENIFTKAQKEYKRLLSRLIKC